MDGIFLIGFKYLKLLFHGGRNYQESPTLACTLLSRLDRTKLKSHKSSQHSTKINNKHHMYANLVEAKVLIEIEFFKTLTSAQWVQTQPYEPSRSLTSPWTKLLLLIFFLQHTLITSFVSSTLSIKQPNSHKIIGVLIITNKEVAKLNTYVNIHHKNFWNPNSRDNLTQLHSWKFLS